MFRCLLAFPPKPRGCTKPQKFNVFQHFRARDSFGVSPVVSSLWPRFEPFWVAMGVERVPWFGDEWSLRTCKSPEFPRRNARTRWGEPAGQFASSHLAVALIVEAGGIEPPSRDISTVASTCVVIVLRFSSFSPANNRLRNRLFKNFV